MSEGAALCRWVSGGPRQDGCREAWKAWKQAWWRRRRRRARECRRRRDPEGEGARVCRPGAQHHSRVLFCGVWVVCGVREAIVCVGRASIARATTTTGTPLLFELAVPDWSRREQPGWSWRRPRSGRAKGKVRRKGMQKIGRDFSRRSREARSGGGETMQWCGCSSQPEVRPGVEISDRAALAGPTDKIVDCPRHGEPKNEWTAEMQDAARWC